MKANKNDPKQGDLRDLITEQRAMELVGSAMGDDRDEPENFIRMLLLLHDNTKDPATTDAIMNLMSAAFECTHERGDALYRYLDKVRGEGAAEKDESARRGGRIDTNPDERVENVMRLGEHLAAILENPETPSGLYNELVDTLNDLEDDTYPGHAESLRENWPRIAEHLLLNPQLSSQSKQAGQLPRKEQSIERIVEGIGRYAWRGYVLDQAETVLWAAQRTESEEEFEQQILADALALVIKSPHTPKEIKSLLADKLENLAAETQAQGPLDPDNIREWFPIALQRIKKQQGEGGKLREVLV